MDYLSGKDKLQKTFLDSETGKYLDAKLAFKNLCNHIYLCLTSDEKAELSEKYLSLNMKKILKDDELVESVNAFFANNLNISETSRNAFLHRNTLLYRIDKIHKKTGLNVKKFDDAITFKILSMIYFKEYYSNGR